MPHASIGTYIQLRLTRHRSWRALAQLAASLAASGLAASRLVRRELAAAELAVELATADLAWWRRRSLAKVRRMEESWRQRIHTAVASTQQRALPLAAGFPSSSPEIVREIGILFGKPYSEHYFTEYGFSPPSDFFLEDLRRDFTLVSHSRCNYY